MFDSLESFFSLVAVHAEALGGTHSWRMGKWIKHGALTLHEGLLRVRTRVAGSRIDDEMFNRMQSSEQTAVPRYPHSYPFFGRVMRGAQELREGYVTARSGAKLSLAEISWRDEGTQNFSSSSRFHFHALKWLIDLLDAYELTSDRLYIERAKELTQKWISECLYTETWPHVWDDHGTALRALALCRLWATLRPGEADTFFVRRLLDAIFRHAAKLSRDGFYRANHNHGVTQAYALLAVGLLFHIHPAAKRWAKLGRSRLERQMAQNVSSEGLHLEHSPYYHFYVFRQFYYAFCLAQACDLPFSEGFRQRLVAMIRAGCDLIKPNAKLAALGDTSRVSPVLIDQQDLDSWRLGNVEEARELLSGHDHHRGFTSEMYPKSGVAILRHASAGENAAAGQSYLIFRLSTFPTTHIHRDAFTFEWFAFGGDLIVDSGGPFDYGHPMRDQYFLTTKAHNTVVVDDQDQTIGESQVVIWRTSAEYDLLVAEHRNYPGVMHRRAIVFIKPALVVVIDQLRSDGVHKYSQLFHLAAELSVTLKDLGLQTENNKGGPTVKVVPLLREGLGLQLHRRTESPYQGWICTTGGRMEPSTVVEYSRRGKASDFVALIVAEPAGNPMEVSGSIQGQLLTDDVTFEISLDGKRRRIVVSPDGGLIQEAV